MKIYEIISKENELVNEAPSGLASKMFGGIASGAAKVLGKEKEEALKYIMSLVDKNTGKISSNLSAAEKAFIDNNPKLVTKAEKAVRSELKQAKYASDTAFIKGKIEGINNTVSKSLGFSTSVAKLATTGWWWYVVIEPVRQYNKELTQAQAAVESGEWTPEKFEQYRKQQMAVLIGKIAEQYIIKRFTRSVLSKIPVFKNSIQTLKPAAEAYFMSYVNSPEGSEQVATIMVEPLLTGVLGGLGTKAMDAISNKVSDANNSVRTSAKPSQASPANEPIDNEPSQTPGVPSTTKNIEYGKSWDY